MTIRVTDGSEPKEGFYRLLDSDPQVLYLSRGGGRGWVINYTEGGQIKHEEAPLDILLAPADPEEFRNYCSNQIKFIDDMLRREEFRKRNGLTESAQSSPLETEASTHSQKIEDIPKGC
jgi:hypothetical protein